MWGGRLRCGRCCLLELGRRSPHLSRVWLYCQSVLLGIRDPQRGTREPTCGVRFFFPRPSPALGDSLANLCLSLSLSCCRRRPPACLCLPPACRRLPPPPPLLSQKGVGPSLISGKLALTYPELGRVRERGRCLPGSVAHCMGCSRARGLMQCCNRVNLQLEV